MKIDPTKKYRTRDGRSVEFLHRFPDGWPTQWPVRGVVDGMEMSWDDDGIECSSGKPSRRDLFEVREPLEVILILDDDGTPFGFADMDVKTFDVLKKPNAEYRTAKFREVIE